MGADESVDDLIESVDDLIESVDDLIERRSAPRRARKPEEGVVEEAERAMRVITADCSKLPNVFSKTAIHAACSSSVN